jgi:succinyl-CoA synthetase beta subunit
LKIHEYQAKEILCRYGVATPRGKVMDDPKGARRICEEFGGRCVGKAQIHAGGRGKGDGVKLAHSPDMAHDMARQILGMQLVTHQTGPEGQLVCKVLIEETAAIAWSGRQIGWLAYSARSREMAPSNPGSFSVTTSQMISKSIPK